ncbi:MAG: 4Fe-4S dicluster domain-containing protein [Proteobacteria bacterium]|nr:4Fe-4S dicluster domain-containing protein [Pseudomonadota bacterium]
MNVNRERCLGCGCCMDGCFQGALELGDDAEKGHPRIVPNQAVCIECEECVALCPSEALSLELT